MDDDIKKLIEYINKPFEQQVKIQFINYLIEYNQGDEILNIAEKIDWLKIIKLFELEVDKLWEKFAVPSNIKELAALKETYVFIAFDNIRYRMFHMIFKLMNESNQRNITDKNINNEILQAMNVIMYDMFRIFDFQFSLTSLNENNDKKVIITKIEELMNRSNRLSSYTDKKLHKKNRDLYAEIFKKNDEYIASDGEGNFSRAVRKVLKNASQLTRKNTYTSFMKFKMIIN